MLKAIRIDETQVKELQAFARQTFMDTFALLNTPEDMQLYLKENLGTTQLLKELRESNSHFYLFYIENTLVAYLKLNIAAAQTESMPEEYAELERIYVDYRLHGKNVGAYILNFAEELAKSLGKSHLWLGVWEQNERAMKFYLKHGFYEFGEHSFTLGEDIQRDILFQKKL